VNYYPAKTTPQKATGEKNAIESSRQLKTCLARFTFWKWIERGASWKMEEE